MNRLLLLALPAFIATPALAEDYAALFEEAASAIEWDIEAGWAFTETRTRDDLLWVARFDPRMDEGDRWSLVSVDGRAPRDEEVREFEHDKEDHDAAANSGRINIVDVETLELVDESDTHLRLRFIPDEDEVEFVENVDSIVTIRKDGPVIETIDLRNHSDIRPGFGTKIGTFHFRMEFAPAVVNGPIVPKHLQIRVSGRALLFIGFDETELIEYSDYEYAGEET